jgi:hypothetical protein
MLSNLRNVPVVLAIVSLMMFFACSRKPAANKNADPPAPMRTHFTTDDMAKLRWIEGTWRGTGDVEKPFYERYRFENDSTLVVETFDNEKVDKVTDSTRFELKDGQFGNGGNDSRWAATAIDDNAVTFEPVAKARNSFRWQRASKDLWQAILSWPAADNKPARQRVYRMERWPAK